MGLPEGRGGDRRLLDGGENLVQRRAQLRLGKCPDGGERDRGHLVLQSLKFLGDLGRKHVEPGGQELAHLDHQAAQLHREHVEALREAPHPLRPGALGNSAQPDAGEEQLKPPGHREMPRGEAQDAAVTGAGVPGAGYRICPVPTNRRHPRQSWARIEYSRRRASSSTATACCTCSGEPVRPTWAAACASSTPALGSAANPGPEPGPSTPTAPTCRHPLRPPGPPRSASRSCGRWTPRRG